MKLKTNRFLITLFALTMATGVAMGVANAQKSQPTAPENTKQLAARVAALRAEMAPFLRSFPAKLDVRKRTLLSGNDWVKRFEVAPKTKAKTKTTGIPRPAWEKVGLDKSEWKQTAVPEWSYMKQATKNPVSCILWYRKDFNAPKSPEGKRTFLVFEGVDWKAEVWLNGHKLGSHSVYFESFRFDVTDFLSKSGKNTLAVRVMDGPLYGEPQAFWGPFSMAPAKGQRIVRDRAQSYLGVKSGDMHLGGGYGILGDVVLETTGTSSISELLVRGYTARDEAVVQVFSDTTGAPPASVKVDLLPENFKGKSYSQTMPFKSGQGSAAQKLTVRVPGARRWSSKAPWEASKAIARVCYNNPGVVFVSFANETEFNPKKMIEVVWNDREGKCAVTRVYDIKTKKIRTLPMAIDEVISPDGKWALCTDFSRLWKLQPGYGYPGIDNPSTKVASPKDAGVWKMDMTTGKTKLLVSLADLQKLPSNKKSNKNAYRYVAHLRLSPNGHQTYIPGTNNEWIITDTYPLGPKREQILHLVHIPTKSFIPLARLSSPAAYKSNWRCDLHPRVSRDGKKVFIDSPHAGGSQVYTVDIGKIVSKATQQLKRLSTHLSDCGSRHRFHAQYRSRLFTE